MIVIINGERHEFTEPDRDVLTFTDPEGDSPSGVIFGLEETTKPNDRFRSFRQTGTIFILDGILDDRFVRRAYRKHTWLPPEGDHVVVELSERII